MNKRQAQKAAQVGVFVCVHNTVVPWSSVGIFFEHRRVCVSVVCGSSCHPDAIDVVRMTDARVRCGCRTERHSLDSVSCSHPSLPEEHTRWHNHCLERSDIVTRLAEVTHFLPGITMQPEGPQPQAGREAPWGRRRPRQRHPRQTRSRLWSSRWHAHTPQRGTVVEAREASRGTGLASVPHARVVAISWRCETHGAAVGAGSAGPELQPTRGSRCAALHPAAQHGERQPWWGAPSQPGASSHQPTRIASAEGMSLLKRDGAARRRGTGA